MEMEAGKKVTVASSWTAVALRVASYLGENGWYTVPETSAVDRLRLRYGSSVPPERLQELCELLTPMEPDLTVDERLGDTLHLEIGDQEPLDRWRIEVYAENDELAGRVRTTVEGIGVQVGDTEIEVQEESVLKYGGATPAVRQVLRWILAKQGLTLSERKAWSDDDTDIYLQVVDELRAKLPPRERFEVLVASDDRDASAEAAGRLAERGFARVVTRSFEELSDGGDVGDVDDLRFLVALGPFRDSLEGARLQTIADELVESLGIDRERYPLKVEEYSSRAGFVLPVRAAREALLPPYSGPFFERFKVTIYSDEPAEMGHLEAALRRAGFGRVEVQTSGRELFGYSIRWGAAAAHPEISEPVKAALEAEMARLRADPRLGLKVSKSFSDDDPDIWLQVPVTGVADGTFADRVCSPARYSCRIRCNPGEAEVAESIREALNDIGVGHVDVDSEFCFASRGQVKLSYGASPGEVRDRIGAAISRLTGVTPETEEGSTADESSILVEVGEGVKHEGAGVVLPRDGGGSLDLGDWIAGADAQRGEQRQFIEVEEEWVRVGGIRLARRPAPAHPRAPAPETFAHYCLDETTAATVYHVAASAALGEACLLEGETSTSKTSSILYLASLLRQPVVRLNLNGQTDTGDLIGRWVPQSLGLDLPFSPEEMLDSGWMLEEETRRILQSAAEEQRRLSRIEIQQIMANERIRSEPWRWQDGPVVRAVREGWWVILDEVNLAEPQILERLNSMLEREPQLVVTEHDGSVFGPGGRLIDEHFRIFATMNPAEYAGRSALSPAYRNRWRGYRLVPEPDERRYLEMLRFLVTGVQPEVRVVGRSWTARGAAGATHGVLADVPGLERLLEALVRFHVGLEHASGQHRGARARIGVRRKERYVFTRRDLLSVMDFMASPVSAADGDAARVFREAVSRYYLGRVAEGEDRALVADLLDAAGIGPNTWSIAIEPTPEVDPESADGAGAAGAGTPEDEVVLELDDDATPESVAEELRLLLRELKATGRLDERASALCKAIGERFERPSTDALRRFDRAVYTGNVDDVVAATRSGDAADRPWLLAGMVLLHEAGFPQKTLMEMIGRMCEEVGAA